MVMAVDHGSTRTRRGSADAAESALAAAAASAVAPKSLVRDSDYRALLRIASEAAELPSSDPVVRRRHLLDSLCKLLGARAGIFFVFGDALLGGVNSADSIISIGFDSDEQKVRQKYLHSGDPPDPAVPAIMSRVGHFLTMRRRQLVDDAEWYRSDHYEAVRRVTRTDHQLYSRIWLPDPGACFAIGIHRDTGDDDFTDRDAQVLNLFHEQAWKLYSLKGPTGQQDPRIASLPPRLKPVLTHLLAGDAEKQVAQKLGKSRHTIHEYTKAIYRHLEVNSRGELLAQFVGKL
jgi:DNA-binding CsgD family transcriptional regulator